MSQAQKVHRMKTHYRQEGIVGKYKCPCGTGTNDKSGVCAPCRVTAEVEWEYALRDFEARQAARCLYSETRCTHAFNGMRGCVHFLRPGSCPITFSDDGLRQFFNGKLTHKMQRPWDISTKYWAWGSA